MFLNGSATIEYFVLPIDFFPFFVLFQYVGKKIIFWVELIAGFSFRSLVITHKLDVLWAVHQFKAAFYTLNPKIAVIIDACFSCCTLF
ncbi:hypothetical protein D3C72_1870020 [compost metagenome]